MSCLALSELSVAERRDCAIREAVRVTGKRLRINAHDREVAVQCAVNDWRCAVTATTLLPEAYGLTAGAPGRNACHA